MPTPTVFLHVGEPKTGTTFLQQVLWRNRSELAHHGFMLPGARPVAHWKAAQDLRGVVPLPNDPAGGFHGSWDRLARQALRAPKAAVISHELFAALDGEQAGRAVASLDAADLHVILTVRDMGTLLPAEWQETVKHRNGRGWEDWLGDVIDHEALSPDRRKYWFWRVHDTLAVLDVWRQHVPLDHLHVITVPHRGAPRGLLWERFCQVTGLPPGALDTSLARSNASLGLTETEVIRRINLTLPEQVPDWFYQRFVKDLLAHDALANRAGASSSRLELPESRDKWAREQGEIVVEGLQRGGYRVVGDLEDLLPRPVTGPRPRPADATAEQLLEAAIDAIDALLVERAEVEGVQRPGTTEEPRPSNTPTVKAALIALSQRSPALHRLRRGYWHTVNTARRLRARAQRSDVR
ncbi:MAG: hypothetical protein ACTHMS_03090 [Jatrophihabitans sp.]|uniref:hypothetical protein n=1 Tax=Jatrophihabitans sp. TaxID=1932789 RepID=UPI003F820260